MNHRDRDSNFAGDWARDDYRDGYGGYYARENHEALAGARGDFYGTDWREQLRSYRGRGPKNYRRSDARIHEEVNERLTDHPGIDASDIEVSVENGEVSLNGSVDGRRSKRLAEDIAESCTGVVDVHNRLRIDDRAADLHIGKASE